MLFASDRRRINRLKKLKGDDRVVVEGEEHLKLFITNYRNRGPELLNIIESVVSRWTNIRTSPRNKKWKMLTTVLENWREFLAYLALVAYVITNLVFFGDKSHKWHHGLAGSQHMPSSACQVARPARLHARRPELARPRGEHPELLVNSDFGTIWHCLEHYLQHYVGCSLISSGQHTVRTLYVYRASFMINSWLTLYNINKYHIHICV